MTLKVSTYCEGWTPATRYFVDAPCLACYYNRLLHYQMHEG